jgi:hypothetical protein
MEQIRPQLDQIETILYTHHQFNGTIWITEIGYHTTGPYQDLDDYDQDLYQQADSLVKVYALTLTDPYIESTVWFYLWDSEGLDQEWQTSPNFGLFYDSDYKIKPVGFAYQLLSSKLSYGFYLPLAFSMSAGLGQWLLDSENLYIYCFQTITNETIFLCWNHLAPASLELHCDQPITAFCQYSFYENIVLPFDVTTFTPTLKYTTIIDNTPRIFGIKTPDGSVAYLILTLYPTGEEIVVWGLLPILSIVGVIVCLRWIIKVKRAKKAKKL